MNGAQALHPHARRRRRRRLLHEPGHVGDALRRRARRRPRDARRARAVRRRRHRRRRRLRPHGRTSPRRRCCTSGPGSATGSPTCTTPAGRARRSSTSSATTRPTTSSTTRRCSPTSRPSRATSRAGSAASSRDRRRRRATRPTRSPRRRPAGQVATLILPADVSWRDGAEPGRRRAPARRARGRRRRGRRRRQGAARRASRPRCCSAAARCASAALRRRQPRSPTRPAPSCSCETFPARLERGAGLPAGRAARLPRRVRGRAARRPAPPRPRRRQGAGVVLRLSRTSRATSCPTAARSTCSRPAPTTRVGALERARRRARRAGRRRGRSRRSRPERPTGALTARDGRAARSARCCPRARSSSDEAQHGGLCSSPAPPRARRAHDWLTLTGGAIGQGLPVATGAAVACPDRRCSTSRPTAARCTRCSRCGRRPARASTSRR